MFMFICRLLEKKYKELELSKPEFHNTRNSSLGSSSTIEEKKKSNTLKFCIYKELELGKLEYCVAWNSSLPRLSSMWHFSKKKVHVSTSFYLFFMKLDLHRKLEFHELEFQKVVYCYLFCKQWYVANNFCKKWQMANLAEFNEHNSDYKMEDTVDLKNIELNEDNIENEK